MNDKIQGLTEAQRILQKNRPHRLKAMSMLESYVDGTQYEGLPDWFSETKPLWERAPCIVYPIVKSAIDSNADLLLGEGRFPVVRPDSLEGEEADSFDRAAKRVIQQARLKAASREVFSSGQGSGSACAIFGLRSKKLYIDSVHASWCTPKLDAEGAVLSLEIRHPYISVERDPQDGLEKAVCRIYRRTIDATADITYKPAKAKEDGTEPSWVVELEVHHKLGFCPVVWYPHLRGCERHDVFDGHAIHENVTDEIRGLDFAYSQRHRAALYAGDPQWTEIGVEPGFNPTSVGRRAEMPASTFGRPGDPSTGAYVSEPSSRGKARKKSPGTVWQYGGKNPEVKVQLHTLPGDALKALDDHAKDLRSKIAEALGVVFLDPESLPNESRLSGKALESFKGRQLDRVNYYRCDFGDRFLIPALGMLFRIAIHVGLKIDGLDVVEKVLKEAVKSGGSWHSPAIDLIWGDYFQPSGEEEFMLMQAAEKAMAAGIATRRILVEKFHSILGVRDVESYMAELDKEREANKQEEIELVKAAKPPKPVGGPKE